MTVPLNKSVIKRECHLFKVRCISYPEMSEGFEGENSELARLGRDGYLETIEDIDNYLKSNIIYFGEPIFVKTDEQSIFVMLKMFVNGDKTTYDVYIRRLLLKHAEDYDIFNENGIFTRVSIEDVVEHVKQLENKSRRVVTKIPYNESILSKKIIYFEKSTLSINDVMASLEKTPILGKEEINRQEVVNFYRHEYFCIPNLLSGSGDNKISPEYLFPSMRETIREYASRGINWVLSEVLLARGVHLYYLHSIMKECHFSRDIQKRNKNKVIENLIGGFREVIGNKTDVVIQGDVYAFIGISNPDEQDCNRYSTSRFIELEDNFIDDLKSISQYYLKSGNKKLIAPPTSKNWHFYNFRLEVFDFVRRLTCQSDNIFDGGNSSALRTVESSSCCHYNNTSLKENIFNPGIFSHHPGTEIFNSPKYMLPEKKLPIKKRSKKFISSKRCKKFERYPIFSYIYTPPGKPDNFTLGGEGCVKSRDIFTIDDVVSHTEIKPLGGIFEYRDSFPQEIKLTDDIFSKNETYEYFYSQENILSISKYFYKINDLPTRTTSPYSTLPTNMTPHTSPYSTSPYSTFPPYSTLPSYSTSPYSTLPPYSTYPYSTSPYSTSPYSTLPTHMTSHMTPPYTSILIFTKEKLYKNYKDSIEKAHKLSQEILEKNYAIIRDEESKMISYLLEDRIKKKSSAWRPLKIIKEKEKYLDGLVNAVSSETDNTSIYRLVLFELHSIKRDFSAEINLIKPISQSEYLDALLFSEIQFSKNNEILREIIIFYKMKHNDRVATSIKKICGFIPRGYLNKKDRTSNIKLSQYAGI